MTSAFVKQSETAVIEQEMSRAGRFVTQCELLRNYALEYEDGRFFAELAYQRAFYCQARYIQGALPSQVIDALRQSVQDFIIGFEFGYPAEAIEVNNWFYRSLVANDLSLSYFFAALPDELWSSGDGFSRFQARWGFAQLRGQRESLPEILESLSDLCIESNGGLVPNEEKQRIRQLQGNSCQLMHAIFMQDSSSYTAHLYERAHLRSVIPAEGTRYERFQPLDLLGLGLCRLAGLGGIDFNIEVPSLPMELLGERNQ